MKKLLLGILLSTTLLGAEKYVCNHNDQPVVLITKGSVIDVEYPKSNVRGIIHNAGLRFWVEGNETDINTKTKLINNRIIVRDEDMEFVAKHFMTFMRYYAHCISEHKAEEVEYVMPKSKYEEGR